MLKNSGRKRKRSLPEIKFLSLKHAITFPKEEKKCQGFNPLQHNEIIYLMLRTIRTFKEFFYPKIFAHFCLQA